MPIFKRVYNWLGRIELREGIFYSHHVISYQYELCHFGYRAIVWNYFFGLVLFTTLIVGVAAHSIIPGISWPLGFLLGAIVSPTDVVAATSITKGLHLSPKVITILEGESLVNDASSLVAYKYAVSAVMAGNFALVFDRKMMISINIWSVFDHDMINRL